MLFLFVDEDDVKLDSRHIDLSDYADIGYSLKLFDGMHTSLFGSFVRAMVIPPRYEEVLVSLRSVLQSCEAHPNSTVRVVED